MKSKATLLILSLVMAIGVLAACNALNNFIVIDPTRGSWDGYVFTSEHLGFRFVLPPGWNSATDAEIAMTMGISAAMLENMDAEMPENLDTLIDMMATSLDGSIVILQFVRLGPGRPPSMDDVLTEMAEDSGATGFYVDTGERGTVTIGAHEWEYFDTEFGGMGVTQYGRQYINIQNGFMRQIIVGTFDLSNPIRSDILDWVAGLEGSLPERPEPPAIEHSAALFGTWEWDMDASFTYEFNPDGTGIRGGAGIPLEEFEWRTEGDHLIMDVPLMMESWTFTIVDDVLTIDSNQVPGLSWNYIRQ